MKRSARYVIDERINELKRRLDYFKRMKADDFDIQEIRERLAFNRMLARLLLQSR